MNNKIILVGGGGHCRSCIDVIEQESRFEIAGIIDNNKQIGSKILNYEIIGRDNDLKNLKKDYKYALITVGQIKSSNIRQNLFSLLKTIGYELPIVTSPYAYVSKHSQINSGTIIMHHAFINSNVQIGYNCIINTKAIIEHDVTIHENCHISTGAIINGGVIVNKNTFLGSSSVCIENVQTDSDDFIKANSIYKGCK